jgi:hypothetical protein
MIPFKETTLYEWLIDYESFQYEFKRFCVEITQAFDLDCRFDNNTLALAHKKWREDCEIWRTQHFDEAAEHLSHIKVAPLLLHHLSRAPFIAALFDHAFTSDPHYRFSGDDSQKAEARSDLVAAREAILSLDFCISIICWYEERRIDRVERYRFNMTVEFRHDIISYLLARGDDPKALYLILEALFLRTTKQL